MKAEYFECKNCGQVVQGWHASESIQCCDHPDYRRLSDEEVRQGGGFVDEGQEEVEPAHKSE